MFGLVPFISLCLLFLLVFGISASVDTTLFKTRIRATKGILVGLGCQFLLLPLLGFASVRLFKLPVVFGIPLIATTCSPGGAYSNWWCSVFNADLALSVAMTACSTVVSLFCMPLNLFLYVRASYGAELKMDWGKLITSLLVAFVAILSGLILGYSLPNLRGKFNAAGNVAGVALIVFGALTSSRDDPLWDKDAVFYCAVSLPCLAGIFAAFAMSWFCGLDAPQRVAVTVETSYQNTGIALTMALATFPKKDQSAAAGVPLFYGLVEVVILPLFLMAAWRLNQTYAPKTERFLRVVTCSYQPQSPTGSHGRPTDGLVPESSVWGTAPHDAEAGLREKRPNVSSSGYPLDLVFDESNGKVFSV